MPERIQLPEKLLEKVQLEKNQLKKTQLEKTRPAKAQPKTAQPKKAQPEKAQLADAWLTDTRLRLDDGVTLHVEASGPADAPVTVILLHGWCLDRRTWHHQIAELRDMRPQPRIVAYDTRGHGLSGATGLASATLGRLGDDLHAVIERYAPSGPVVLAGHSLGGMTIMEYAHDHPDEFAERVKGLFFVSTTAEGHAHTRYGLPTALAALMRAGETLGAGVLARSGPWCLHRPLLPALRPAVRWLLFGDDYEEDALRLTLKGLGRASLRAIGGFRPSVGAQQRLETLAELGDVPAAALVGDRDRLTPPACAESIAAALPGTELKVFPGAGHMLQLERAAEVSAALLTIVEQAAHSRGQAAHSRGPAAHSRGPAADSKGSKKRGADSKSRRQRRTGKSGYSKAA